MYVFIVVITHKLIADRVAENLEMISMFFWNKSEFCPWDLR